MDVRVCVCIAFIFLFIIFNLLSHSDICDSERSGGKYYRRYAATADFFRSLSPTLGANSVFFFYYLFLHEINISFSEIVFSYKQDKFQLPLNFRFLMKRSFQTHDKYY